MTLGMWRSVPTNPEGFTHLKLFQNQCSHEQNAIELTKIAKERRARVGEEELGQSEVHRANLLATTDDGSLLELQPRIESISNILF